MPLNPPITRWHGTTAWVVGASSGIGRATALAMLKRGAQVVVSARSLAPLQQIASAYPNAVPLALDVTNVDAVRAAHEQLLAQGAAPDLVLACAGHYRPLRATAFSLAEMRLHNEVNYMGCANLLDAVLPTMLKRGQGHISLMGSVAGYRGLPQALAYGPTKAALNNLADVLYMDLHDSGLGVSIINPGFVDTGLTAQNEFHMPALQTPEHAAEAIVRGWEKGNFEIHFPRRFTLGLKILQLASHSLYFAALRHTTGL